jgi:hypothetical protein
VYVLRLAADDGAVKTFDSVTITSTSANTVTGHGERSQRERTGPGHGQFTFTRTGPTAGALTVNYTVGGTAVAADYAALPVNVVIPDGQPSTTLTLTPVDDASPEGPETVVLSLDPGFLQCRRVRQCDDHDHRQRCGPDRDDHQSNVTGRQRADRRGRGLEATATDDGLPNALTLTWSKVSGPGTVTFAPNNTANTAATFSAAGIYVLRLTANDSQFSGMDEVTVNYAIVGKRPSRWSKVGVQTVEPGVTLSGTGAYTLAAAGSGIPSTGNPDDFYFLNTAVTGDVTITARLVSVQNVNGSNSRAGVMIRNSLSADAISAFCGINSLSSGRWIYRATAATNSANSQATAGLPYWVRLIRSGNTFTAQFAPDNGGTPGAFTTAGTEQTLTMGNSVFVGLAATSGSTTNAGNAVFDNVAIAPVTVNVGASVNAGSNATVALPATASLDGTVADDGKPAPVTTTWSKVSGPGDVTFGNAAAIDTSASFTVAGNYILRLVASDSQVKTFDDVAINVQGSPIEQWRVAHFGGNAGDRRSPGILPIPMAMACQT